MKEEIKESILKLYPSGRFEEKNIALLFKGDYLNSIYDFLKRVQSSGNINYFPQSYSQNDSAFSFVITLKEDPDYNHWMSYSDEEKIKWIKQSNRKYPVLWLIFSTIYPLYEIDFDYWTIRDSTGQLITESDYETDDKRWYPFLSASRKLPEEYNIQRLPAEELLEDVDFVKEEFFEEAYDLDSGHKKLISLRRNTNVYQCMFQ